MNSHDMNSHDMNSHDMNSHDMNSHDMNSHDMNSHDVVKKAEDYAKACFACDSSGHDWHHTDRVRRIALMICRREGGDPLVVELAALLHDIDDWKFADPTAEPGVLRARVFLSELGTSPHLIEVVMDIVNRVSFKGADVPDEMPTIEGQCVVDADRLEAIGAIGIARAFAYGGFKGRPMHDPLLEPKRHGDFVDYQASNSPTINHFYEKLLLLKERMQTATGLSIANKRHQFLLQFLDQFLAEWNLTCLDFEADEKTDRSLGPKFADQ